MQNLETLQKLLKIPPLCQPKYSIVRGVGGVPEFWSERSVCDQRSKLRKADIFGNSSFPYSFLSTVVRVPIFCMGS